MDDDLQNPPGEVKRLFETCARRQLRRRLHLLRGKRSTPPGANVGSRFTNWCADRLIDKPKGLYLSSFRCVSAFVARADHGPGYSGPYPYVDGLVFQVTQNWGAPPGRPPAADRGPL